MNFHGVESHVTKQTVADAFLHSNGSIHLRSFGLFNLTLWDDMIKEFEEDYGQLTPADIVMINFGAWYDHFSNELSFGPGLPVDAARTS